MVNNVKELAIKVFPKVLLTMDDGQLYYEEGKLLAYVRDDYFSVKPYSSIYGCLKKDGEWYESESGQYYEQLPYQFYDKSHQSRAKNKIQFNELLVPKCYTYEINVHLSTDHWLNMDGETIRLWNSDGENISVTDGIMYTKGDHLNKPRVMGKPDFSSIDEIFQIQLLTDYDTRNIQELVSILDIINSVFPLPKYPTESSKLVFEDKN